MKSWICPHGTHVREIAVAVCGCERPCALCNGAGQLMARVQRVTPAGRICTDEMVQCPDCAPSGGGGE